MALTKLITRSFFYLSLDIYFHKIFQDTFISGIGSGTSIAVPQCITNITNITDELYLISNKTSNQEAFGFLQPI